MHQLHPLVLTELGLKAATEDLMGALGFGTSSYARLHRRDPHARGRQLAFDAVKVFNAQYFIEAKDAVRQDDVHIFSSMCRLTKKPV